MPLRELLLFLIVAVICLAGLIFPQIGLCGYLWFSLFRPDAVAWVTDQYQFSKALAICTLVGSAREIARIPTLLSNPFSVLLLLLHIPIGISVLLCQGPFLASERYTEFIRLTIMALMIPVLFYTRAHMRLLLTVICVSLGMLGLKFGLFSLIHGGVTYETANSSQYDNNTFGLVMAMAVPIIWYTRYLFESKLIRSALLGAMFFTAATVPTTTSRGASLALGIGLLYIVLRSKGRMIALLLAVLALGPIIYLIQESYVARMSTLADPLSEASAASRVEYAQAGLKMWLDYPVFGVGFGARNYAALSEKYLGRVNEQQHGVHNTYIQMLVDSGVFAGLIYGALLFGSIWWLGRSISRMKKLSPENTCIPMALQASLLVFAVGGTFGSMQRLEFVYDLLMCVAVWYHLEKTMLAGDVGSGAGAEQQAVSAVPLAPATQPPADLFPPELRRPARGRGLGR